jgi:hypothetical protein
MTTMRWMWLSSMVLAGCLVPVIAGSDDGGTGLGRQCGGFAGAACLAGLDCVDYPYDDCDPLHGGADCIGWCVQGSGGAGGGWGGGTGGTGGSGGAAGGGAGGGLSGPSCGGFAGTACDGGLTCVDDPNDGCDPANFGADCPGICIPLDGGTLCNFFTCLPEQFCKRQWPGIDAGTGPWPVGCVAATGLCTGSLTCGSCFPTDPCTQTACADVSVTDAGRYVDCMGQ